MRLLIVDDEYYTRQGILGDIDFSSIGITETAEADDGYSGLEKAQQFFPQIVLTDVLMPRMDGVKMAFAIKKKYAIAR